jgi:hypothetical protein
MNVKPGLPHYEKTNNGSVWGKYLNLRSKRRMEEIA